MVFLAKSITFIGKAAHSGVAPEEGINALNAAILALSGINAQRDTFRDEDSVSSSSNHYKRRRPCKYRACRG